MDIDIIGDIHGCYNEFVHLTTELGYKWLNGIPIHPANRKLAFVGDLTDRGPNSLAVIEVVHTLVCNKKQAYYVPGNHCDKLYRYFLGRNVQKTHGLETTVAELAELKQERFDEVKRKFCELVETSPIYQLLDNEKLIIAHAGLKEDYIGRNDKRVKTFVLYGDITGELNEDGTPVRKDWAKNYQGNAWIVYGHTPVNEARYVNRTVNIDTGCVFGGKLTAFRYPELTIVSVSSSMPVQTEKFRNFL